LQTRYGFSFQAKTYLALISQRVSILILIIATVFGANFYSVAAFWPLQAQQLFGPGAVKISYDLLPYGYGLIVGIVVFNWALSLFPGAIREFLALSSAMLTAGIGAMAAVTPNTPALARGLSFLAAVGSGGLISPLTTVLTCVTPDDLIGTVTAIITAVRYLGASIGYAVYFTVLQRKLADVLRNNVVTAAIDAGLPLNETTGFAQALLGSNLTALAAFPSSIVDAGQEAVKMSYQESFKLVYLVSIAFGAFAFICCLFLGNVKKLMVNKLAVDIH